MPTYSQQYLRADDTHGQTDKQWLLQQVCAVFHLAHQHCERATETVFAI